MCYVSQLLKWYKFDLIIFVIIFDLLNFIYIKLNLFLFKLYLHLFVILNF